MQKELKKLGWKECQLRDESHEERMAKVAGEGALAMGITMLIVSVILIIINLWK